MKRFLTACGVAVVAVGVLAGCNDYNTSVQYDTGATLTNLSPSGMPAGTPSGPLTSCPNTPAGQTNPCFTIFVIASASNGFQSTSVVEWNAQKMYTTYIDAVNLSAQIPYSLIAQPGSAAVQTYTPQSGAGQNGLSNALTFTIYGPPNPAPTLTSIAPTSAVVCTKNCSNVNLLVVGTNFLPTSNNGGSKVTYTGLATSGVETAINVNSISSCSTVSGMQTCKQIKAVIPASYLNATDQARINVLNPSSDPQCLVNCPDLGGGDTNDPASGPPTTQIFTITAASSSSVVAADAVAVEAPAISQEGRYVAYASIQNGTWQILRHDTCLGAPKGCTSSTETMSVAADGTPGNADSHNPAMTSDGRYVAFSSASTNLVENSPPGRQVYLRDTCAGSAAPCKPETLIVSTDEQGKLVGFEGLLPSVSASGRFVAFVAVSGFEPSSAEAAGHRLAATPPSGLRQVFVRDTCIGAQNCTPSTTRISLAPGETPAGSGAMVPGPALSGLARQVALVEGQNATVFTPTVPVDDQIFLALPAAPR